MRPYPADKTCTHMSWVKFVKLDKLRDNMHTRVDNMRTQAYTMRAHQVNSLLYNNYTHPSAFSREDARTVCVICSLGASICCTERIVSVLFRVTIAIFDDSEIGVY